MHVWASFITHSAQLSRPALPSASCRRVSLGSRCCLAGLSCRSWQSRRAGRKAGKQAYTPARSTCEHRCLTRALLRSPFISPSASSSLPWLRGQAHHCEIIQHWRARASAPSFVSAASRHSSNLHATDSPQPPHLHNTRDPPSSLPPTSPSAVHSQHLNPNPVIHSCPRIPICPASFAHFDVQCPAHPRLRSPTI